MKLITLSYFFRKMGKFRCAFTQCCIDSRVSLMKRFPQFIDKFRPHLPNSHARIGWAQFTDNVIKLLSDKRKGSIINF